jgi:hypothetical protein
MMAHHDCTENAPEQNAVLILPWDCEEAENRGDDEDIIHR